jgi:hypothetical protein
MPGGAERRVEVQRWQIAASSSRRGCADPGRASTRPIRSLCNDRFQSAVTAEDVLSGKIDAPDDPLRKQLSKR